MEKAQYTTANDGSKLITPTLIITVTLTVTLTVLRQFCDSTIIPLSHHIYKNECLIQGQCCLL